VPAFGLHTLAAPQVFYRESPSQIERAGGLELPFGTRSAASQHGGPVSPFELVTAQLRHDVLRRDHACARSARGCGTSRRTAATPGLLVIARADDVDGVAVTGIKDRAD
jgi:hypothetical protein